jgi:hypothetical protein
MNYRSMVPIAGSLPHPKQIQKEILCPRFRRMAVLWLLFVPEAHVEPVGFMSCETAVCGSSDPMLKRSTV